MTEAHWFGLYFLVAFVQAVIVVRRTKDKTDPVFTVIALTLVAPVVLCVLVLGAVGNFIMFLVEWRN